MDMPRPKCKEILCKERSIKGSNYCDEHKKEKFKEQAKTYGSEPFYQTRIWKRIRLKVLSENPLCVECQSKGRVTGASVVDHILSIKQGGDKTNKNNLQSLCTSCHNRKRGRERWE